MRSRHKGWIVPDEEIPTLLQQIEAKIASSEIELRQRDALIRLRHILEDDLSEAKHGRTLVDQEHRPDLIPSKEQASEAGPALDT